MELGTHKEGWRAQHAAAKGDFSMGSLLGWHGVDRRTAGLFLEVPALGQETASQIGNMEISIWRKNVSISEDKAQRWG